MSTDRSIRLSTKNRLVHVWHDTERHGDRCRQDYDRAQAYDGRTYRLPFCRVFVGRVYVGDQREALGGSDER